MSAFTVGSENLIEGNIPAIPSGQKDYSSILPTSPDLSFQIKSPGTSDHGHGSSLLLRSVNLDLSTSHEVEENIGIIEEGGESPIPGIGEEAPVLVENVESSDAAVEGEGETDSQRREREDRESEALAWEMMQQENLDVYNMQVQFMQENAGSVSEEDMLVMQQLMEEGGNPTAMAEEEGEEEEEEGDELEDSDSSNWNYDRLLTLGQRMGGEYLST
jgi:hypothetical protein